MSKHNLTDAVESLRKKQDIKIVGYEIQVLHPDSKQRKPAHDVGNGSWGKIDYLVKKHNYRAIFVNSF